MSIQNVGGSSGGALPIDLPTQKTGGTVDVPASKVAVQQEAKQPPVQPPSGADIKAAVEELQKAIKSTAAKSLSFSVDQDTGKSVVRVTDRETGQLIRQIPSEELLQIAKSIDRMQGMLQGMLLKQKA